MRDKVDSIMKGLGIGCAGACDYADLLPPLPCRALSRVPADASSVIVCLFPYYIGDFARRNIARYAVGDDYHGIVGTLLASAAGKLEAAFPGDVFSPFVDSSPVREVLAAYRAGLGVVGLSGQLIHPQYGSYVFIGTIVTTLRLVPDSPLPGSCLGCGQCIRRCPTGALCKEGPLDTGLCRSHITQKKGTLTPWEQQQIRIGGLVWGCDICTDVCPMNQGRALSPFPDFFADAAPWFDKDHLEELLPRKAYGYRGKQVLLRNYQLLYGGGQDQ